VLSMSCWIPNQAQYKKIVNVTALIKSIGMFVVMVIIIACFEVMKSDL
jgi:hypothetical protein